MYVNFCFQLYWPHKWAQIHSWNVLRENKNALDSRKYCMLVLIYSHCSILWFLEGMKKEQKVPQKGI